MGQEDLPFPRDDSSDASDPLAPDRESGGTRATRELEPEFPPAVVRSTPVILRSPPNWTAIIFFMALGVLHLSFAGSSFVAGHPEGYLSLFFGTAFSTIALGCWLACCEVAVLPSDKRVRLRTGFRRVRIERFIPFERVRAVRLTLNRGRDGSDSRVELLCDDQEVECPATPIPRQQALYLALALGVRLIKVCPDDPVPPGAEAEPTRL